MADNIEMRLARLEAMMAYQKGELMETLKEAYTRAVDAQDEEAAAAFARQIRNKLLDGSDKFTALDRAVITLPESITTATMLTAFKTLIQGLKNVLSGDWSNYRQHLRDIPEQKGFPFDIDWGTAPDAESGDEA